MSPTSRTRSLSTGRGVILAMYRDKKSWFDLAPLSVTGIADFVPMEEDFPMAEAESAGDQVQVEEAKPKSQSQNYRDALGVRIQSFWLRCARLDFMVALRFMTSSRPSRTSRFIVRFSFQDWTEQKRIQWVTRPKCNAPAPLFKIQTFGSVEQLCPHLSVIQDKQVLIMFKCTNESKSHFWVLSYSTVSASTRIFPLGFRILASMEIFCLQLKVWKKLVKMKCHFFNNFPGFKNVLNKVLCGHLWTLKHWNSNLRGFEA